MERIDRAEIGLLIAQAWALRGTCRRRKVGCLLVDKNGYPLASGYNGPPAGEPHCIDVPCAGADAPSGTGLEKCEAIHAEQNALLRCADPSLIHSCFVTSSPCMHCVKMLMNTECEQIVFAERYAHDTEARERWIKSTNRAGKTLCWLLMPNNLVISKVGG